MEIGGYDQHFETTLRPAQQLRFARGYVQSVWPEMVEEEDHSGEWFFYRDQAAKASWDKDVTEENAADMIHFIPGEGSFTLVHGGSLNADECRSRLLSFQQNCDDLGDLPEIEELYPELSEENAARLARVDEALDHMKEFVRMSRDVGNRPSPEAIERLIASANVWLATYGEEALIK